MSENRANPHKHSHRRAAGGSDFYQCTVSPSLNLGGHGQVNALSGVGPNEHFYEVQNARHASRDSQIILYTLISDWVITSRSQRGS